MHSLSWLEVVRNSIYLKIYCPLGEYVQLYESIVRYSFYIAKEYHKENV